MDFYQFNTISAYSFYESTIMPFPYAERAKHLGYKGIAIADENLYSFPALADACNSQGLKPIFGYRVHLRSPLATPFEGVLLVQNEKGYANLLSLVAKHEPIIGNDLLLSIHEGLTLILDTSDAAFKDKEALTKMSPQLLQFSKIFGEDFHFGISIASIVDRNEMPVLYEFCDRQGYDTVAFPKTLYLRKENYSSLYLLQKAVSKEKAGDIPQGGPDFLLSVNSIEEIYREKDIFSTQLIADKIDFQFFRQRGKPISFDDADNRLYRLSYERLAERLKTSLIPPEYHVRLDYELSVIRKMKFSSYFLLVSDYVDFAKSRKIEVGPGRGSSAGSLVAYSLGITELDPIRCSLSFERFLNPKRKDMPDIDIDFQDDRREEVVTYLKARYGESRVSDIVTFVKLKPKGAINLIGPALSYSENRIKRLTSSIPDSAQDFEQALLDPVLGDRLRRLLEDNYFQELVEKVKPLLGIVVNTSIHAAGVIISQEDIYRSCPMRNGTFGTSLFEYPYMERLGFLKCDILSLSNLTFIRKIEEKIGKEIDVLNDLEDKKAYDCLNALNLSYIFQLESSGMKRTIEAVKPASFKDIASILALYRPGPKAYIQEFARRKNEGKPIIYADERMRPILQDTYGIILFQEQVIELVKVLAGFDASDADLFRRAISKKKLKEMEQYREKFLLGAKRNGIPDDKAQAIYEDIEKFAGYGFNKSHAYSYSLISYKLLYLKAHYPESFYKTALKEASLSSDATYESIKEIYRQGYILSTPNINVSAKDDIIVKDNIFYLSLNQISMMDKETMEAILIEREKGAFKSFYDFCLRMVGKITLDQEKTIKRMIDGGAFDCLSKSRSGMKAMLSDYLSFARMGFPERQVPSVKREEDVGKRLYLEKQTLGVILSQSLKTIARKAGYRTLLVLDDAKMVSDHAFLGTDGRKEYMVHTEEEGIQNNDFVLVKADFAKKNIYHCHLINLKGRKETYE